MKCNQGKLYLTSVMDWHNRYIPQWRLSNTMDTDFCLDSLDDALEIHKSLIFNTNQGSQYTSDIIDCFKAAVSLSINKTYLRLRLGCFVEH